MVKRLRTLTEAYNDIVEEDPNTAITKYRLREMIKEGQLKTIKIGKKNLIDYDELLSYISASF